MLEIFITQLMYTDSRTLNRGLFMHSSLYHHIRIFLRIRYIYQNLLIYYLIYGNNNVNISDATVLMKLI